MPKRLVISELEDKDWLIEHYVNQRLSVPGIAGMLNCSKSTVFRALYRHEIPRNNNTLIHVGCWRHTRRDAES
jgi:IS30 family transposase